MSKEQVYKVVINTRGIFWFNEKNQFHRLDGPACEYYNGQKSWYINDKFHREDGPAIEHNDGTKKWCINGFLHREDGPAIEYADGDKSWYLNGKAYSETEYNQIMAKKNRPCVGKTVTIDGVDYQLA